MRKGDDTFAADIQQKISLDTGKPIDPFHGKGKRLAIFFFYDKDGIVDGYVDVLLGGLNEVVEDFVVVVNGKLSAEGRKRFEAHTQYVLVRENVGLDAWAYKESWNLLVGRIFVNMRKLCS